MNFFLPGIRGIILSTATSTVCRTFGRAENRCHWSPSWYVINSPLTWPTFLMHIWICITRIRDTGTRCPGRPYSWKWTTNDGDGDHYLGHSFIVPVDVVVSSRYSPLIVVISNDFSLFYSLVIRDVSIENNCGRYI